MERRVLLPWLVALAAAAAAVTLAIRHGEGTVDVPTTPVVDARTTGTRGIHRGLPSPLLPPGFPGPAAEAIRAAWPDIEGGPVDRATAALATLTPVAAESPLQGCSPAALEALGPALGALITGYEDLAVPAMKCAAALSRAGGPEGRSALGRTGLIKGAFAGHALYGTPALQIETAALLGFAGGDFAQQLLALLLAPKKPAEVRAAAALGLAEAFPLEHRLRPDAIQGVLAGAAAEEPPALRRACLQTMDRAWEAFRPYGPGPLAAAALSSGDRGLQLEAATFFCNHVLPAQGEALLAAVPGAGEDLLAVLADALALHRPEEWKEPLRKRLPGIQDPAVLRSVKKAMGL